MVKIMGEVEVQGLKMGPTSYCLTSHSFNHLCRLALPEVWLIQNLPLKIKGQYHISKSCNGPIILSTYVPLHSMSISPRILEIGLFQNRTLKIQGQDHRSYSWCKTHSMHFLFLSWQSAQPFPFKIWQIECLTTHTHTKKKFPTKFDQFITITKGYSGIPTEFCSHSIHGPYFIVGTS